jgi:hypothetical protein
MSSLYAGAPLVIRITVGVHGLNAAIIVIDSSAILLIAVGLADLMVLVVAHRAFSVRSRYFRVISYVV